MRGAIGTLAVGLWLWAAPVAADVPSPAQWACRGLEPGTPCSFTNEPPYGTGQHSGTCVEVEHPMKKGVMHLFCRNGEGQAGPPSQDGSGAGCAGCTLPPPGPGSRGLALALSLLGLVLARRLSPR